uniref:Uncharacterized protein n=1 Tax=Lepeophtheirus salmonis TaxID=72036 RepID=A0A0K2U337_LEPSM
MHNSRSGTLKISSISRPNGFFFFCTFLYLNRQGRSPIISLAIKFVVFIYIVFKGFVHFRIQNRFFLYYYFRKFRFPFRLPNVLKTSF